MIPLKSRYFGDLEHERLADNLSLYQREGPVHHNQDQQTIKMVTEEKSIQIGVVNGDLHIHEVVAPEFIDMRFRELPPESHALAARITANGVMKDKHLLHAWRCDALNWNGTCFIQEQQVQDFTFTALCLACLLPVLGTLLLKYITGAADLFVSGLLIFLCVVLAVLLHYFLMPHKHAKRAVRYLHKNACSGQ